MKFHRNFPLFIFLLTAACSSSQLVVESQPEGADVVIKYKDSSIKKIGLTPFKISEDQLSVGTDPYQVIVQKEKFQKESFLISPSKFSRDVKITTKLENQTSQEATGSSGFSVRDLSEVANATAQSINYLKLKNYDLAERSLSSAIGRYPSVSTLYVLLGNTFYLKKELDRALSQYKKARDLDPLNLETDTMIKKIESLRGNSGGL